MCEHSYVTKHETYAGRRSDRCDGTAVTMHTTFHGPWPSPAWLTQCLEQKLVQTMNWLNLFWLNSVANQKAPSGLKWTAVMRANFNLVFHEFINWIKFLCKTIKFRYLWIIWCQNKYYSLKNKKLLNFTFHGMVQFMGGSPGDVSEETVK